MISVDSIHLTHRTLKSRNVLVALILLLFALNLPSATANEGQAVNNLDRTVTQWSPYLEWSVEAPSVLDGFFDVIADVTFIHTASGETRTTQMFYDGGSTWKFRFTGTQIGEWTFTSASLVPELDGLSGTITVELNPNPQEPGFVTNIGNKWARGGTGEVFTPQFVMGGGPQYYYEDLNRIDEDIALFLDDHGFNGITLLVLCRWFDINQPMCSGATPENPDPRTFEVLETLINRVYQAGGVVHIWVWGDDDRRQNPNEAWGQNSEPDKRLQRYIAARLGPLPGWTMGYGFDLFEWTTPEQVEEWHAYVHQHLGWDHYLGGRGFKEELREISPEMDYASYENSRPDYDWYLQAINLHDDRPVFAEDRYRVWFTGGSRDFTEEETLRLMWYSMMVGGVANIWGYLGFPGDTGANDGGTTSLPYPNKQWLQTHFRFWEDRFFVDMTPCNDMSDGYCLGSMDNNYFVFYKEDADTITLDLSALPEALPVVAVDTKVPYVEFDLGTFSPENRTWHAPYISDWALAVGQFEAEVIDVPDIDPEPTPIPPEPEPDPTDTPQPEPDGEPLPLEISYTEMLAYVDPGALADPNFTWQVVAPVEPIEWYNVLIVDVTNTVVVDTWVDATTICVGASCTFSPQDEVLPAGLTNGDYRWFLRAAIGERRSNWVEGVPFRVNVPAPQLPRDFAIDLSGMQPVFTWADDLNTAFYQVYLGTADGETIYNAWIPRTAGWCDGTRCTFSYDLSPDATHMLYVQAWNAGGFSTGGNWNGWNGITFDLTPPDAASDLAYADSTFSWTAARGATRYQLWIGSGDARWHQRWYSADELGCSTEGAICAVRLNPLSGTYQWFVQTWGTGGTGANDADGWQAGPEFTIDGG